MQDEWETASSEVQKKKSVSVGVMGMRPCIFNKLLNDKVLRIIRIKRVIHIIHNTCSKQLRKYVIRLGKKAY